MNHNEEIAKKYFEAFHEGKIEEVLGYFSEDGVVQYGTEVEKKATDFFPETKEMIAQIKFDTHGVYTSPETKNVIIHFSYEMPNEEGKMNTVEAIDVIAFDETNKISSVKVIPNE